MGLDPLRRIIAALPVPGSAAVFVVMHVGPHPSMLPRLLSGSGRYPASFAQDGALIEAGHVYVAPPEHHVVLGRDRIRLSRGPKVHHTRPAADPLFISAAQAHGQRVMGVVLSGGGGDGAAGFRTIGEHGGTALVQGFCCIFVLPVWSGTSPGMTKRQRAAQVRQNQSFKGRQFTAEVILWAVRWYLMFPISYRDLELMLLDRGVEVDHTTIFRWIQAYAAELEKRIRPHLRMSNGSWRVDETYVKVKGRWTGSVANIGRP